MTLNKENVWDYPRPAICQTHEGTLEVILDNKTINEINWIKLLNKLSNMWFS